MKLILSQYLRTLKERDEFDRLLPDLLLSMGYVPISKPQIGVRQFGVDLAVVGAAEDGVQELLLLVIKRGDIGRVEWDSAPQSVRQSLNEIVDVYLKSHIEPAHKSLRKKIVVATTGDLKQEVQVNWDGYVEHNTHLASFEFWRADYISLLIEKHLLNENIFSSEDRTDFRKALALAGEVDYDQRDLHRLFQRQLGLGRDGDLLEGAQSTRPCDKAFRVINLATHIYARWSEDEGNSKQALLAFERALLWCWHRINLQDSSANELREFSPLWWGYKEVAARYFAKLQQHLYVEDGLSGYARENAEFSLIVFEQIGLIATIGLSQLLVGADEKAAQENFKNASIVADALAALITNNPVSGSPRLDENVIDITLGLLLLSVTNSNSSAEDWLAELVHRIDYTFRLRRNFPICSDSIDDLVDSTVSSDDEELQTRLMKTSWLLPTLAAWSIILGRHDLYDVLAHNTKTYYPEVCLQLWHATPDLKRHLYYWTAHLRSGETEAPIVLPQSPMEFGQQMRALMSLERYNFVAVSPACLAGMDAIDIIAARHFRTPLPPSFWYRLLPKENENLFSDATAVSNET